jgi:hypothetical protein
VLEQACGPGLHHAGVPNAAIDDTLKIVRQVWRPMAAWRQQRSWMRRTQRSHGRPRSAPRTTGPRSRCRFWLAFRQGQVAVLQMHDGGSAPAYVLPVAQAGSAIMLHGQCDSCTTVRLPFRSLQADPGAPFVEQYGAIQPVPQHDGTECLKWDDSLWGHAEHFKVPMLPATSFACGADTNLSQNSDAVQDSAADAEPCCAAVPVARVQEHPRGDRQQ